MNTSKKIIEFKFERTIPKAKSHEKGWNYFLDLFPEQLTDASRQRK
jgi:hypothetical protein